MASAELPYLSGWHITSSAMAPDDRADISWHTRNTPAVLCGLGPVRKLLMIKLPLCKPSGTAHRNADLSRQDSRDRDRNSLCCAGHIEGSSPASAQPKHPMLCQHQQPGDQGQSKLSRFVLGHPVPELRWGVDFSSSQTIPSRFEAPSERQHDAGWKSRVCSALLSTLGTSLALGPVSANSLFCFPPFFTWVPVSPCAQPCVCGRSGSAALSNSLTKGFKPYAQLLHRIPLINYLKKGPG